MKTIIRTTAALMLLSVAAFASDLVNVSGASNAAVNGFDSVAFFTGSKPVNGSPSISAEYKGATYYFANSIKVPPGHCGTRGPAARFL